MKDGNRTNTHIHKCNQVVYWGHLVSHLRFNQQTSSPAPLQEGVIPSAGALSIPFSWKEEPFLTQRSVQLCRGVPARSSPTFQVEDSSPASSSHESPVLISCLRCPRTTSNDSDVFELKVKFFTVTSETTQKSSFDFVLWISTLSLVEDWSISLEPMIAWLIEFGRTPWAECFQMSCSQERNIQMPSFSYLR